MKKVILISGLLIIAATGTFAQKSKVNTVSRTSASTNTSVSAANRGAAKIQSNTHIAGQLQSTLDAKSAKVGDQVILKTTNTVRQNGQVVVQKGSKLIGHVTEVQQRAKNNAGSRIGILFDTLQQGGNSIPISAVITSIIQAQQASTAAVGGDDMMTSGSAGSTTTASTSTRSSGGTGSSLLGGVGQAVGSVVNTTTQTVGGVANTAGQTLGSTTSAVGGTLQGLQITQSTDASASGGSTLSLRGENLKLNKGATFNLNVSQSSSVRAN